MNDRNKSQLTHDVTRACSDWLDNHGFKPWETEVWVADGWIADVAAAIVPTQTELINLKLLSRKPSWDLRRNGADWTRVHYKEWNADLRALSRLMLCVVEVKTSRSDFKGDKKWAREIPADLGYLAFPHGMLAESEWPAGWGILEFYSAAGEYTTDRVVCKRAPLVSTASVTAQLGIMFQIALRKDHSVRYASFKAQAQEDMISRNESVNRTRMSDAFRICLQVIKGDPLDRYGQPNSIERILGRCGVKKLPHTVMDGLHALWGSGGK